MLWEARGRALRGKRLLTVLKDAPAEDSSGRLPDAGRAAGRAPAPRRGNFGGICPRLEPRAANSILTRGGGQCYNNSFDHMICEPI